MAYIGNAPVAGENNSFKILDDISSYTLTFDGSSASVVSTSDNTITYNSHRFITAQRVTYNDGGGTAIGGLADGVYYIIKNDQNTIKLAASEADANTGTAIPLTSLGVGSSHTLNVAFDGVNTKFKATYDNGTKAQISRAAQLMLSVNGVIQQPNDTTTPTNGFGFDLDSVIIFSVAPTATDSFWGNLVANNFPTFDISDNTIDSFTGDNSTVDFTLSKTPANNQNILVTLDGVVQYPSDATNTRAYSVTNNILTFVSAPGNGVAIQVRHIGFAGAVTSAVTGFYGRTGNVGLSTSDNAEVLTLKVGTGTTFTEDLVVQGNARVTGILTIGTASLTLDGTNNQIKIGTGITLTESGSADYTGIVTATGFVGNVTGDLTSSGVSTVGQLNVGTGGTIITTTAGGDINIDSGGVYYDASNNRFGIGTTSPGALLTLAASIPELRLVDSDNSLYGTITAPGGDIYIDADKGNGAGGSVIRFAVDDTERMRITSLGYLKASNTGSYNDVSAKYHEIRSDQDDWTHHVSNSHGSNPFGLLITHSTVKNNTGNWFFYAQESTTLRFQVRSNGGIANYQGNDANLCDEREKKNIETLDSTWSCLKNWELKKFHYNEDADTDEKRYGVIAQQVAEHCPEVITDWVKQKSADAVLDDDGNVVTPAVEEIVRMGVKEQQMMWMAIKALQEAQTRIETLEAEVASLKGA